MSTETKVAVSTTMMATTHAFMTVAIAALAVPALSEYAAPPLVLAAAFVGGLAPDFDMLASHRKTLHFPVYFPVLAAGVLSAGFAAGSTPLVLAGVAVAAAAVHSLSDVFAGSPEAEPWNPTTDIAVYNHALGRWHRPRRYVRYSGAPEDFLLAAACVAVAVLSPATGVWADSALVALLTVTGLYTAARKHLTTIAATARSLLPVWVPTVSVTESEHGGSTLTIRFR
ncbi:metal-dependent hydrolase [Haloarcula mannanilytica]|nr:metal-dependent hydrolase [Haloarcula mannanilytica]